MQYLETHTVHKGVAWYNILVRSGLKLITSLSKYAN